MSSWFQSTYFPEQRETLAELMGRAQLNLDQAAEYLGVSPRTLYRWRHNGNAPEWARLLLAIRGGHMPWPQWRGWYLQPDGLVAPGYHRRPLAPGDILAMHWHLQQLAELKRHQREFQALPDQAAVTRRELPRHSKKGGKS